MGRKILTVCLVVLLLVASVITVSAEEFDPEKTASISVTLAEQYEKTPIAGAELSVYYIATVGINTDRNLNYIYTDDFATIGIAMDDPDLAAKFGVVSIPTLITFKAGKEVAKSAGYKPKQDILTVLT